MNKYSLTERELQQFLKNGWIGPFDSGLDDEFIDICRAKSEDIITQKKTNPLFGRYSVRDWHLVDQDFLTLFKQESVIQKVKSIFGSDSKLWRSKIFRTPEQANGVGWHQEWGYFNGEEVGNDVPALLPSSYEDYWNLTLWLALDDITTDNSPMKFFSGSHKTRRQIKMVPITESAFYVEPFTSIFTKEELVKKVTTSTLLLDINTTRLLDGVNHQDMSLVELKEFCIQKLQGYQAAVTLPFDTDGRDVTALMKKGQFVIFTERCMHCSLPNVTNKSRIAFNCRITPTSTQVYPGRDLGYKMDGSNLDVSSHHCVDL